MSAAVVSTLLFGLVIAATPWAIVIVLALLDATRGLIVAWAYVLGWAGAIAAIGGVVVFWLGGAVSGGSDDVSSVTLVLDAVIGIVLLGYGGRRLFVGRVAADEPTSEPEAPPTPRWLGALEELRPVYAFGLGVFWLNYPLVILWGGDVVTAAVSTSAEAVLLCAFVALGAAGVGGLSAYATFAPVRARPVVVRFRSWMTRNAGSLVTWLAIVVGAGLLLKGIVGLV